MIGLKKTLSAEKELIEMARDKTRCEGTTLNVAFCWWLRQYVGRSAATADFRRFMDSLKHARPGCKFLRDELNES
jgi:hypothetical protein